jgi:PAS domain S-box-containing protein
MLWRWLAFIPALATAFFIIFQASQSIFDDAKQTAEKHLQIIHQNLQNELETFKESHTPLIMMLSRSTDKAIFDQSDPAARQAILKLLKDIAASDPYVMQLRYLDLLGNEHVRIDRNRDGRVRTAAEYELQNKSHRDYFKQFGTLEQGEITFSGFDLNVENKMVEIPFNPTLRIGMLLFDDDQPYGMVVVNLYMQQWIDRIMADHTVKLSIFSESGYFLVHHDSSWAWSQYLKPKRSVSEYFNKAVSMSEEFSWIDGKSAMMPIEFFGSPLMVVYEFDHQPGELKEHEARLFGFITLLAIVIVLLPMTGLIHGYIRQILKRTKEVESAESYFTSLFNNTFDAIVIIDQHATIKKINRSTAKLFGYNAGELIGQNVNILVPDPHHDHHDGYVQNHDTDMTSKIIGQERELFGLHKSGELIPISIAITRFRQDDETFFVGSIRDLSEQKHSQLIFEKVFDSSPFGISLMLPDGSIWKANPAFERLSAYKQEELRHIRLKLLIHPDDIEQLMVYQQRIHQGSYQKFVREVQLITKNGDILWVSFSMAGIFNSDKKHLDYIILMAEDITERRLITDELQQTKKGLDEAEQIANVGHWSIDLTWHTVTWSESMFTLYDEYMGHFEPTIDNILGLIQGPDREKVSEAFKRALWGEDVFDVTYEITTRGGIDKVIHARARLEYNEDGKAVRLFGTCQDITELHTLQEREKENERMLLQQSKLAAMGEMLGAIAHQWRQPLNSIGLIMQDLVSAYKHDDLDEAYFKECQDEMFTQLHFMSGTIDEFRNFFTQSQKLSACNLVSLVQELKELYWAQAKAHSITMTTYCMKEGSAMLPCEQSDVETPELTITNYPSEIKQLILNLVSNAKEAIEKIDAPDAAQKEIQVVLMPSAQHVTVEVRDIAGGIPEDVRPRIFEPYFTTKEMGTGLGLYIVKTLAEEKLGATLEYFPREVELDGATFEGTIFRVTFPRDLDS